jgi:hypothetical protein
MTLFLHQAVGAYYSRGKSGCCATLRLGGRDDSQNGCITRGDGGRVGTNSALSDNDTPPADACPTYRTLYVLLQEFEAVTKKHVHLENNILFSRAIEMEREMVASSGM